MSATRSQSQKQSSIHRRPRRSARILARWMSKKSSNDTDEESSVLTSDVESETETDKHTDNAKQNHNTRKRGRGTSSVPDREQKGQTPPSKRRKLVSRKKTNRKDIFANLALTKQSILREMAKLDEFISVGKLRDEECKKERDELQSKLNSAQQANEKLTKKLNELQCQSYKDRKTIGEYKEQLDQHKKEKAEYQQHVQELKEKNASLMKYDLVNLEGYGLNPEDLNRLEMKFHDNIKRIKKAKNILVDEQLYCVACKDNKKNVATIPCNHVDLCEACESSMERKICPRCNAGYQFVFKLNV